MMVLAAGHFKQTQASAIIEMVLNIGVSVVMTLAFGLIGVAIGMVTAMVYRTVYFALYLKENILFRDIKYFVKNLIVDLMCMAIPVAVVCCFPKFYALGSINYFAWGILAVKVGITCLLTTVVVNWLLNRSKIQNILKKVKKGKRVS